jgi:ParB/RepB/Spo0J family partition protein
MPDKNDLIRKAQEKVARPAFRPGSNLQSVKDKLKGMGRSPAAPVVPEPTLSKPSHLPPVVELVTSTSPTTPSTSDGALTFEDLKTKKFNSRMEYIVPFEWIDWEDSKRAIDDRETYNRDTYETMRETAPFQVLVEDIKNNGQQVAGRARVNEFGLLKITDGWRRALAGREAKTEGYLCIIKDESDEEAAVNALRLNLMREDLPEYNKLYEIKKLNERFNLTYEVIAKKTGFGDKVYISNCLNIFKVPAIEEALKAKRVSISTGRHLAKKALADKLTEPDIRKMVDMVVRREVALKDLQYLDMKDQKPKVKAPSVPNFEPKEDGSFTYPAFHFKPKTIALREIEKAIGHLETMIKILRKEVKERQK